MTPIPQMRVPDLGGEESDGLQEAAALGLAALAGVVAGAQDGIAVIDADRRFVYANAAGCEMFGYPLDELLSRDFLSCIPVREHATMAARFAAQLSGSLGEIPDPSTTTLVRPDGSELEIMYSRFAVDGGESPLDIAIFQDLTGPRAASRAAMGLAQAAGQLVGAGSTAQILTDLARHAVAGTRALSCGITIVDDDHKLAFAGAYGPDGPGYGEANPAWIALADAPVGQVIEAMTLGGVVLTDLPGKPVVMPDARAAWEANALTRPFAANLSTLDWRAGVFLALSWRNRVFGFFAVFLPTGLAGPSEAELAFYTALADQAAVVTTNARLNVQAALAATTSERARLARELHDSVSQGLFSMTMHARAAQMSMARAGLDAEGQLGRSIGELAQMTQDALAEMRALIFELRPTALAEEGLVGALRKQAAALTAREQLEVTIDGPEQRLAVTDDVQEHLYRIASEALRNVIDHAAAHRVTVSLTDGADDLRLEVNDDGVGFDQNAAGPGHLGLSGMVERAESIGGQLAVTSAPGSGTTVVVSVPNGQAKSASRPEPAPSASADAETERDRPPFAQGGTSEQPSHARSDLGESSKLADAAALGLRTLAAVLSGTQEAIVISDATQHFVYLNPAACQLMGRPLHRLLGQHFLSTTPAREHHFRLSRFSALRDGPARYSGTLMDAQGNEHEAVYSSFLTEIAGSSHSVAIIRDVTGARAAGRTATALAQTAAQSVQAGITIGEVLAGVARHAVEGTRALACGISAISAVADNREPIWVDGGYGPAGATYGEQRVDGWLALSEIPTTQVIEALTGGAIVIGGIAGKPLVLPDARSVWEANPILETFVATTGDWRGTAVFLPLSWGAHVFGWLSTFLPDDVAGPTEIELAFLAALADQAAVAVTNARLAYEAGQAAASVERGRLAHELHDSVSQSLFSMTMHARAAQLAMADTDLDQDGALAQSIAELAQLARGAMAEMRALIFELRPAALTEEGLVSALSKQAAALSARERTLVTSQGPAERLGLDAEVEEHVYRIVSEALHNVVNHAQAHNAAVRVTQHRGVLGVEVNDDGAGFDPTVAHPGHLGLSTMAERAEMIGATLTVTSSPGSGTSVVLMLAEDQTTEPRRTSVDR